MNNSKQKSASYIPSLKQLCPRDVKQSDNDSFTMDYAIVNTEWKMVKLPRRPGRRRLRNKISRKIRQIQVELRKKMFPKDKRLQKMLGRALWLKRCAMNPEMFKTFDINEESVSTAEEQESIVSMLLSDPILVSDSWSCTAV